MPQPLPDDIKAAEQAARELIDQECALRKPDAYPYPHVRSQPPREDPVAVEVIARLTKQLNSLTSEVETLRADKNRLDWLELQEHRQMVENENITDFLIWYPWTQTAWGKTYRAAIDAAIALQHKAGV